MTVLKGGPGRALVFLSFKALKDEEDAHFVFARVR